MVVPGKPINKGFPAYLQLFKFRIYQSIFCNFLFLQSIFPHYFPYYFFIPVIPFHY